MASLSLGLGLGLSKRGSGYTFVAYNDAGIAIINAWPSPAGKSFAIYSGTYNTPLQPASSNNAKFIGIGPTNPMFRCDTPLGVWVASSGETDIWEQTVTLPNDAKCLGNAGYDTTIMPQVANITALRAATIRTIFMTNWQAATSKLQIKMPAGVNPNTDGLAYWCSTRLSGVVITGNNTRVHRLDSRRNAHQDGAIRMLGTNYRVTFSNYYDGCRHNAYGNVPGSWEDCGFYGGRNDLESPGTANGLVLNQSDITGQSGTVLRCTFDGKGITKSDGTLNFTGPYSHGSVATMVLDQFTVTGCTFIDCASGPGVCALNNDFVGSTYVRCRQGFSINNPGTVVNISGTVAGSTLNVLYENDRSSGTVTINSTNNYYTIPNLGAGQAGFYKTEAAGTTTNLTINGDVIDVQGVAAATTNANRQLIRHRNGTLKINNTVIGPAVCNRAENLIVAGFSSGTVTYDAASDNNVWPIGGQGTLNATSYTTLAAWKAGTGADTNTTTMALPTAVLSDDFATGSGNLESRSPWTKLTGGATGALTYSSAAVNAASGTITAYAMGDTPTANQYVQFTVSGVNAASGAGLALRVLDVSNAAWVRWRTAAWEIAQVVSGTVTQPDSSTTVTPAVNDVVTWAIEEVTDPSTAAVTTRHWLYVNNRLLRGMIQLTLPALTAETTVGAMARSTLQTPLFTNVRYGTTR